MSDYTPGPWYAGYIGAVPCVLGADRRTVAECNNIHAPRDLAEAEANARLIAAAPLLDQSLYLLLCRYLELVNSGDAGFWDPEEDAEVMQARGALKKARGEL